MIALWRRGLRLALLGAVVVLALMEAQAFVVALHATGTRRQAWSAQMSDMLAWMRPVAIRVLRERGARVCVQQVFDSLPPSLAAEVEILDSSGRSLVSYPAAAPVDHVLSVAQVESLRQGASVVAGPVAGREPRMLGYVAIEGAYLRVASRAPELFDSVLGERQRMTMHGITLVLMFVILVLLLTSERGAPRVATHDVNELYAEAVQRLQLGQREEARRHEDERKRLEQATRDLEVMARAGELTAGIVHEVRNGLGTIQGYAQLLAQRTTQEDRAIGQAIREECETLTNVVRRFVEFAQRETLHVERFVLRRLLERVVAREFREWGVDRVQIVSDEALCQGDEALLERAFENLVRNARDAAGTKGHVWIEARCTEHGWRIHIDDDGPGPDSALSDGIRPFQSGKPGGLGLGLPLAQKLIRLHGGALKLVPHPPRGLRAEVTLPDKQELIPTVAL